MPNVPKTKVGRNLLHTPNHPLKIIKDKIAEHFRERYRGVGNEVGAHEPHTFPGTLTRALSRIALAAIDCTARSRRTILNGAPSKEASAVKIPVSSGAGQDASAS